MNRAISSLAIVMAFIFTLGLVACTGGAGSPGQDTLPVNNSAQDPDGSAPVQTLQTPDAQRLQAPEPAVTTQTPEPAVTPAAVELVIFAAASMTDTLEEVAVLYRAVAPHVTLVFNFDSSGTLKTQIEEGAECDLFISAAQRQMNELEELGSILGGTRVDILVNRVTLVVAPGNPKNITGFGDLVEALTSGDILVAIGNSDVPVGQYTQRIFEYFELDEDSLARSGVLTYGSNVREVTLQVSEASVDAGVVYATDAYSANLVIVDYATEEMCGQVIYPAAVLSASVNIEAAQAFLDYLSTDDAMAVFESVGFSAP